jgi:GNAT superfamily N-acetyltransferase
MKSFAGISLTVGGGSLAGSFGGGGNRMVSSQATLRLADPASVDRVLPLFRDYQAYYHEITSATEAQTRTFLDDLVARPEVGFVVLAEVDGELAGFTTAFFTVSGIMAERVVHLGDLYVAPPHRRRGIATRLLDEVASRAHGRGIRLVRWLSVASDTELIRWYESLGATSGVFRLYFLDPSKRAVREPDAEPGAAADGGGM